MEQFIMEGSYTKVWEGRTNVPQDSYAFFMDLLMGTLRKQIAATSEKAYQRLPLVHAQKVLLFDNQASLLQFVGTMKEWSVKDGYVLFNNAADADDGQLAADDVIRQTINYAKELERIV
eukprot:TRINITY_DN5128_c0_g1_i1.p2 TRINITY_DN5128_c0_g1~~TRINITY_DN5128_c0_g1_i1.p2  ORF type:complete len:119 (+),score=41.38 TRINITY_DN5128_c0_g1_i1:525-881(+)